MVIFKLDTKQGQEVFKKIKRILTAGKSWKTTIRIEITVIRGNIHLVGPGFVKELEASTSGTCKLTIPVHHWFELIRMTREKFINVVVSEGEAMVGRVSVSIFMI